MAASAYPVLWHFPISHYNEKVRWALDWKRIPHVRQTLGLGYLPRALWATGQGSLPILFLAGTAIADSTRIIAALQAHQPEPSLYPRDAAARERALALEDFFDEELGHALRAAVLGPLFVDDPGAAVALLTTGMGGATRRAATAMLPLFRAFYRRRHAITPASIAAGRRQVLAALDRLEAELQPSGYLVGGGFTVADLTAAALLAPLVLPPEFPYHPLDPPPAPLAAYRQSLAHRDAIRWVTEMYRRHRGASAEVGAPARAA